MGAEQLSTGYCFGAPFVLDLAEQGSIVAGNVFRPLPPFFSFPLIFVGAVAHPAFLEESHFEKTNRTFHPLFLHHV